MSGALRDLVPFVQFKKRENTHGGVLLLIMLQAFPHLDWIRRDTEHLSVFSPNIWKSATLLKVTLLHGYFSRFLIVQNGT